MLKSIEVEVAPQRGRGVIARYRKYLPVSDSTPIISLGEGGTPLIFSPRLSAIVGRGCEVFVKYEGLNPTCSFKDRGMTVAVSKAVEHGTVAVICASTGNTSASAAAYAARIYAALHELDMAGVDRIVVALPPKDEAWAAIQDRLQRAAAPDNVSSRGGNDP